MVKEFINKEILINSKIDSKINSRVVGGFYNRGISFTNREIKFNNRTPQFSPKLTVGESLCLKK